MNTAREFINVFRLYRRFQPTTYAARAAWRIAVLRMPF